jgi:hypothetical protein
MSTLGERLRARLAAVEGSVAGLARRLDLARQGWHDHDRRIAALEDGPGARLLDLLDELAPREDLDALTDTVRVVLLRVELLEQRSGPRRTVFTLPGTGERQS